MEKPAELRVTCTSAPDSDWFEVDVYSAELVRMYMAEETVHMNKRKLGRLIERLQQMHDYIIDDAPKHVTADGVETI